MAGFMILDFALFSQYPQLTDGARMLYGFIIYRMRVAETDENGDKFITYHGDDDPRPVLGITKKVLLKRSKELLDANLIITEGSGWSFKLKLGTQKGTEINELGTQTGTEIEETENTRYPNGYQDGNETGTETVPKREPSAFNINIEKNIEIQKVCINNTPSIEDIFNEANAKNYIIRDPQKFLDYNEAREWRGVGGVQNWRLALKLWHNKEIEKAAGGNSGSITGAQAGILYHCPVELEPYKVDNPTTVTAEDIKAADEIQALFDNAIDNIIDLF